MAQERQGNDHIAAEVRAELARQRISQRRLAARLSLSQAQVSDRMTGKIDFKVVELIEIAKMLGKPLDQFLPEDERVAS